MEDIKEEKKKSRVGLELLLAGLIAVGSSGCIAEPYGVGITFRGPPVHYRVGHGHKGNCHGHGYQKHCHPHNGPHNHGHNHGPGYGHGHKQGHKKGHGHNHGHKHW